MEVTNKTILLNMFHFVFEFTYEIDTGCWENIKNVSSKYTERCKCCKIYCVVIQSLNTYVAPHNDSRSDDLAIRRSFSKQRLCSWRSNSFVRCISVPIEGIFLKLHFTYRTVIWYSRSAFWWRSVGNEGHFNWRTGTYLAVSRFSLEGFSK
jgi:hypothetical protein